MTTVKDSGTRREFGTGAVRDTAEGKGSMVSISGAALLRMAKVMEGGAHNYGRFNYMKGMPISDTIDSLGRHYAKYLDGWDDEDHLAMVAVNAIMAMETEDKHPELIDHPLRIGKGTFSYPKEQHEPKPPAECATAKAAPESPDIARLTKERDFWRKAYEDKKILNRILSAALKFQEDWREAGEAAKATDTEMQRMGERLEKMAKAAPGLNFDPQAAQAFCDVMQAPSKPSPAPRPYKIIAVDFDGTLCVDAWPEIGEANLGAIGPLLHRIDKGDKAILWTCREGKYLDAALEWCGRWGIKFAAVNANLPERIAEYGGDCRKCSADEYWDDKAVTVRA